MNTPGLTELLDRPLAPPDPGELAALARSPIDPTDALPMTRLDRLLDPAPLPAETGWCLLPDGVGYVAARTPMPGVRGEMVDWWFDWHPQEALRYRVWHPGAHRSNRIQRPGGPPRAKPFWDTRHLPVEDLGSGDLHVQIDFRRPTDLGFSTDALDDPRVATVVGGRVSDPRLRVQHTLMVHVFLREGDGLVLRSRFWMAAIGRSLVPGLGAVGAAVLRRPGVRRRLLPQAAPAQLAAHCLEEYANLAVLLPELFARYGPGA